ncbi:membrane protein [Cellulomonas sp. URHE0023]|uniref:DoxX family protein n=1 Tax=Cellulomonas sp. URHE0023 TaxID=1380354 RepID=UPI000480A75B|nr:membrane protein [Cellulomonas sp. URHE0023]
MSLTTDPADTAPRLVSRVALGLALLFAGISHLTFARQEFRAQVPSWFPVGADVTVLASGAVEVGLGAGLVISRRRVSVGLVTAAFFVAIFPGNISQWLEHKDGFRLDTDARRLTRLFFQPVLVAWALWSTGALEAWRNRSAH